MSHWARGLTLETTVRVVLTLVVLVVVQIMVRDIQAAMHLVFDKPHQVSQPQTCSVGWTWRPEMGSCQQSYLP